MATIEEKAQDMIAKGFHDAMDEFKAATEILSGPEKVSDLLETDSNNS